MKIDKLVKIATGGLAVLVLSVTFMLGAQATSGHPVDASARTQSDAPLAGNIDWP
ncbi:hypothetical protein [Streptomyces marianii]|uniref:hypothetical protein n=1 Tax=Streptomyces marianii TaxID=1817406 RepID=UPI001486B098|nr:hypothetical protein [Streptomyces marianii]